MEREGKPKRELVPLNEMYSLDGGTDVYMIKAVHGRSAVIVSNILDQEREILVKTSRLRNLSRLRIGELSAEDAFERFFQMEQTGAFDYDAAVMDSMKELAKDSGFGAPPYAVKRAFEMYLNLMELVDELDLVDPYEQLNENENENS